MCKKGDDMKLTSTQNGGRLELRLSGELDHHEARQLLDQMEERIEEALPRDCVLDLRELRFMDSSGIAVILRAYKRMNALGGRLFVENVQSQPLRVLDASGIDRMIEITPDSAAAEAEYPGKISGEAHK